MPKISPMDEKNRYLASLLAAIVLKDVGAFELLYGATNRHLFKIILAIVRQRADADELLQDVYIKVWARAAQYQAKYSPMAWLVAISKNQARDFLRMRAWQWETEIDCELVPDTALNPERLMIDRQAYTGLLLQIEQLDAVSAALVRSAYLEGHSYKHLAELYRIPLNTVRTVLRRSLIKMSRHATIATTQIVPSATGVAKMVSPGSVAHTSAQSKECGRSGQNQAWEQPDTPVV